MILKAYENGRVIHVAHARQGKIIAKEVGQPHFIVPSPASVSVQFSHSVVSDSL